MRFKRRQETISGVLDTTDVIRRFRGSDAEQISVVIRACLTEINSRDYQADIIDRMLHHFTPETLADLATSREMWVYDEGSPLATVSRDGNKVFTMFVDPAHIGRGIGRALMSHIELLAADDGFAFMETGASITAHNFYRRLGYHDVRTTETDFGLNYILRKPLRTAGQSD